MAQKRMFTMKIVDSDAFLDMPLSTQCLYFHLNMRADDDGFIGNPRKIMRMICSSEDDLKLLVAKRFVLVMDDGVIVIKHWRMHNCISQNRYHETQYIDQKSMLRLKGNNAYSLTEGEPLNDTGKGEGNTAIETDFSSVGALPDKGQRNNYPDDFEAFWSEYPRKADKGQAYKKYQARINSGYSPEELLMAAKNYREECEEQRTEQKFIKHAKTFLGDATPFQDYIRRKESSVSVTQSAGGADFSKYL